MRGTHNVKKTEPTWKLMIYSKEPNSSSDNTGNTCTWKFQFFLIFVLHVPKPSHFSCNKHKTASVSAWSS